MLLVIIIVNSYCSIANDPKWNCPRLQHMHKAIGIGGHCVVASGAGRKRVLDGKG